MKEFFRNSKQEQGFTLIELMIVIAIIGILAAIAIPNFLSYQRKGYDSAAQAEAMSFLSLAMTYYGDKGTGADGRVSLDGTPANFPTGFGHNGDITIAGSVSQNSLGEMSGLMSFNHDKSSQIFILDASAGTVTRQ